jgi:CheY-like chemotaxis protein
MQIFANVMSKKEIYLIEDSADFRHLVRAIFDKFLPNYHVRFFQGGAELYQFMILQSAPSYSGRRPGLLIMDLEMPAIGGVDMIKLVRQTPSNDITEWKTMPIVVLSSSTSRSDIDRCYKAGVNSFFIKPTDFEELRSLLETICHYWIDHNQLAIPDLSEFQTSMDA